MARRGYEGSPADEAEDARGAKALGVSKKAYEGTARDKREDRVGSKRHKAKKRSPPVERPHARGIMPGPNEFDAGQEQSMRAGARASRMPPPMPEDDMGM